LPKSDIIKYLKIPFIEVAVVARVTVETVALVLSLMKYILRANAIVVAVYELITLVAASGLF
jgi:hypothetical protein